MNREEYKTLREAEHRGYVRGHADKKIEGRALFDQGLARGQENLEAQVKAAEDRGFDKGFKTQQGEKKATDSLTGETVMGTAEWPRVSEIDGFKKNPGEIDWSKTCKSCRYFSVRQDASPCNFCVKDHGRKDNWEFNFNNDPKLKRDNEKMLKFIKNLSVRRWVALGYQEFAERHAALIKEVESET